MHSPYLRNGELCPTSLKAGYLHKLFGILWEVCLFSIIYLSTHLFILVWTHESLFYALGYVPYYVVYFIAQIIPAVAINSFSWFLCLFDISLLIISPSSSVIPFKKYGHVDNQ